MSAASTVRDVLCEDIDAVLQKKPESFEAFLQELKALDYEIKCGKHISVKGKNQARFIRLSSLEEGYTEADLRAHFLGQQEHKPREKRNYHTDVRPFNLVIDIQSKLKSKGAGYQRWASVYNLKQMSKTLLFLRDHKHRLTMVNTPEYEVLGVKNQIFHSKETRSPVA